MEIKMETTEKKARLGWSIEASKMVCSFPDGTKSEFVYGDIKEYIAPIGIVAELFQHGLKQKLADSVAGMTKNGIAYENQALHMESVWKSIKSGEAKSRSNSADPKMKLSETIAIINAMDVSDDIKAVLIAKISGK